MPTLLVGDASSNIQRVVDLTFAGQNIRVIAVTDGEQAVARIATEPPDIVLVDVAMPTRSGYDVCEYVKHTPALAHIPVLLLAGAFEPVDESRAQQVRWDGIVVKPFEPQHLAARVRELLAGRAGSSSDVVAGVPRAIERLGLRASAPTQTADRDAQSPGAVAVRAAGEESNAIDHFHSEAAVPNPALDEYFERLDTALSSRPAPSAAIAPLSPAAAAAAPAPTEAGSAADAIEDAAGPVGKPPARADVDRSTADAEVPTLDRVLSHDSIGIPPLHQLQTSGRNPIADAFGALLSAEMGEPGAQPMRLIPVAAQPIVTDALIDDITRRVLQRLSTEALDRVVADLVSDVAERLVRDEIARIRSPKSHAPSPKPQQAGAKNENSNL